MGSWSAHWRIFRVYKSASNIRKFDYAHCRRLCIDRGPSVSHPATIAKVITGQSMPTSLCVTPDLQQSSQAQTGTQARSLGQLRVRSAQPMVCQFEQQSLTLR